MFKQYLETCSNADVKGGISKGKNLIAAIANDMEVKTKKNKRTSEPLKSTFDSKEEGSSTIKPPFFDGSNYFCWKNRMQIFFMF